MKRDLPDEERFKSLLEDLLKTLDTSKLKRENWKVSVYAENPGRLHEEWEMAWRELSELVWNTSSKPVRLILTAAIRMWVREIMEVDEDD